MENFIKNVYIPLCIISIMAIESLSAIISGLTPVEIAVFAILFVWTLVWKGIALWKSAKLNNLVWFIIFLIPMNTAGILEILYVFIFSKLKFNHLSARKAKNRRK